MGPRQPPPAPSRPRTAAAKEAARRDRSTRRVATHGSPPRVDAHRMSILESKAVKPVGQLDYARRVAEFHKFCAVHGLETNPEKTGFEFAVLRFMDQTYLDGRARDWGDKLKAALEWCHPELSKRGHISLPRMVRALKGWRKAAPTQLNWPMPELGMYAVCGGLLMMGLPEYALKNALDFSAYLRPSEGISLAPSDVITPCSGETAHYIIQLFPFERSEGSKTQNFDETVVLDSTREPWLGELLASHADDMYAKGSPRLWSFTAKDFALAFKEATHVVGLKDLEMESYQNRHGGVSRDAALKLRDKEEQRRRGRWAGYDMVRRYEQPGRLEQYLAKFPLPVLQFGRYVREYFTDLYHGTMELSYPLSKEMESAITRNLMEDVIPRSRLPRKTKSGNNLRSVMKARAFVKRKAKICMKKKVMKKPSAR